MHARVGYVYPEKNDYAVIVKHYSKVMILLVVVTRVERVVE